MSPARLASPVWRLSHLNTFKPTEGGRKTFRPNRYQAERYNRLYPKFFARQGHMEIELKSRKFGATTGCCCSCLDCAAYAKEDDSISLYRTEETHMITDKSMR